MRPLVWFAAAALIGLGVSALAGCASPAEQFASNCNGYGFERGTEAFAGCVQNEALARQANTAAGLRTLGSSLQQQSQTWALQRSLANQQRATVPYVPVVNCYKTAWGTQCR